MPKDADKPLALHALVRKYAEIANQADQARSTVQKLTEDLAHIEAAIRLLDASIDISAIRPNRPSFKRSQKGEVTNILLDVLREAGVPLPPRTITDRVMKRRGMRVEDVVQPDVMLNACAHACEINETRACCILSERTGSPNYGTLFNDQPVPLSLGFDQGIRLAGNQARPCWRLRLRRVS
ncbi:hypothetical protein NI456_03325 [Brevundimonas diminuta]|uniref:hypothetical protein n=1 Tax=Brevundimonas diminuta TaxID=293 RepID=UPI00209862A2|nr:hypothetical protein [Brevundimonas diminuta]MCO8017886.1 hypothetical protein [Brevundimonas diminuta]MCO8021406.1 hypothetical protein [Brevundimonas diminuta]